MKCHLTEQNFQTKDVAILVQARLYLACIIYITDPPTHQMLIRISLFVSGSSQLCYSCAKAASMEECDVQMTEYNCSMVGAFHTKCARFCDWKKSVYMRECAIDLKCKRLEMECDERKAMQEQKQKVPECEYKCCEGNLCNADPCNLGRSIRPRRMGVVGSVFVMLNMIRFSS